ncbi:MAG: hypothetical protein ACSHYA_16990 [Opitutaceae bacterium]
MKVLLILLNLVFITTIYGTEEPKAPVFCFAFGGVGFAGSTSEGETLFFEALHSDDPKAAFHAWYEKGNNSEKAYCMIGFYYFDQPEYLRLKEKYQGQRIMIPTMMGCIGSSITLNELTNKIESDTYKRHIEAPKASIPPDPFEPAQK